jgi:uncharacterized membrane protein
VPNEVNEGERHQRLYDDLRTKLLDLSRRNLFWSGLSPVWSRLESRPAFVFILLSFAFGSAISVVVPPLRGPDEIAHFLRIYSYARGGLLPATEVDGRKGIFIERELYTQLSFFKNAGERFARNREQGLRYGEIMKEDPHPGGTLHHEGEQATKFMPFAGTEGYNPIAYAPYVLAAAIGNLLGLDFPNLLLLMRVLGLITFTAVTSYAIKLTPTLKWAFLLIAMLPVSIYNRSVLSADGAALTYALVITALCFRAVQRCGRVWERSLWMTLCALSKQPQIVFVLLELMVRITEPRRRWSSLAIVVVPSFILSPLWVIAVSADIAAWRLLEGETHPREHFDPLWKLAYMWEHPLHFPLAAWTALTAWRHRLWQELIGILGWQDILLRPWTYFVLTVILLLVSLQKLNLIGAVRARVAVITGLAVLGYVVTVYLIFFLTYTPLNIDHVRGVQGRYFVIALPMAAIFLASATNVDLPRGVLATTAITGSLLSGITSFEALLVAHWSVP